MSFVENVTLIQSFEFLVMKSSFKSNMSQFNSSYLVRKMFLTENSCTTIKFRGFNNIFLDTFSSLKLNRSIEFPLRTSHKAIKHFILNDATLSNHRLQTCHHPHAKANRKLRQQSVMRERHSARLHFNKPLLSWWIHSLIVSVNTSISCCSMHK